MAKKKNRSTQTRSFGSSGRISHDATLFYNSRLYEKMQGEKDVKFIENPIPANVLDSIHLKSAEAMDDLPDNSVHLMVNGSLHYFVYIQI